MLHPGEANRRESQMNLFVYKKKSAGMCRTRRICVPEICQIEDAARRKLWQEGDVIIFALYTGKILGTGVH
jgi:hypothetical protein